MRCEQASTNSRRCTRTTRTRSTVLQHRPARSTTVMVGRSRRIGPSVISRPRAHSADGDEKGRSVSRAGSPLTVRARSGDLVDKVDVITPQYDYVPPELVSLFVTNVYAPSTGRPAVVAPASVRRLNPPERVSVVGGRLVRTAAGTHPRTSITSCARAITPMTTSCKPTTWDRRVRRRTCSWAFSCYGVWGCSIPATAVQNASSEREHVRAHALRA